MYTIEEIRANWSKYSFGSKQVSTMSYRPVWMWRCFGAEVHGDYTDEQAARLLQMKLLWIESKK